MHSSENNLNIHILKFKDPENCPMYDQIINKDKIVEGRINSKKNQLIKVGDVILLSNSTRGILECLVTYINLYSDIQEYVYAEGLKKVFGDSTKCKNVSEAIDGVKIYEEVVSISDVSTLKNKYGHGFLGIGINFIHEYKIIHSTLKERWFRFIQSGEKTIEGRLDRKWVSELKPYDMIEFTKVPILSDKKEKLQVLVTGVKRYKSFYEIFDDNGLKNVLPDVKDKEEGLKVYRQWYSEIREKEFGVVGIFFNLLNYKIIYG
jgi:ASC-1-like (ASCH) protein